MPSGRLKGDRGRMLRQKLAQAFDLPKDIILDLPRIIIVGDLQLVVENHRGIVEYTPDKVVLAMENGRIHIVGEDLIIGSVYAEEITVTGKILSIAFKR